MLSTLLSKSTVDLHEPWCWPSRNESEGGETEGLQRNQQTHSRAVNRTHILTERHPRFPWQTKGETLNLAGRGTGCVRTMQHWYWCLEGDYVTSKDGWEEETPQAEGILWGVRPYKTENCKRSAWNIKRWQKATLKIDRERTCGNKQQQQKEQPRSRNKSEKGRITSRMVRLYCQHVKSLSGEGEPE